MTLENKADKYNHIKRLSAEINTAIHDAKKEDMHELRHLAVSMIAPEYKRGGGDGVLELGLTYDTTTRFIPGVHGGLISNGLLIYNRYVSGKKETITEKLPERVSFSA